MFLSSASVLRAMNPRIPKLLWKLQALGGDKKLTPYALNLRRIVQGNFELPARRIEASNFIAEIVCDYPRSIHVENCLSDNTAIFRQIEACIKARSLFEVGWIDIEECLIGQGSLNM